ncbi:hypothetical protein [uncultured Brevundimonas sp.]|uniref:hypothetical protein n=1 Tax=uncultured Brevundimonas sp. TaxID=213418 RepID=UPI00261F7149|nr:hypothetical protein [uncultured Brevundimonas sp.]
MLAACGPTATSTRPNYPTQSPYGTVAHTPVSPTEVPYYSTQSQPQSQPARTYSAGDRCGAAELQWLVGRNRSEIPVPVDVSNRRVTCTACAITEDHREDRLTILYDRQTNVVASVRCG